MSALGEALGIRPDHSCHCVGDGDASFVSVTAIHRADGMKVREGEDNVVPLNVLMMDARGDEDEARVGSTSLNGKRDTNGGGNQGNDIPFTAIMGLLLLLPKHDIREHHWDASCMAATSSACPSLQVGRGPR